MRPSFLVCIQYDEIGPSSSVLPVDVRLAWFFVLALLVPVDIKLFNLGFGAFVSLFYFNFQFPSSYVFKIVLFFSRNIYYAVLICIDTMRPSFLVCIRYDEIGPSSSVLPVDVRLAWFFVLVLLVPVDIKLFNLGFGAFVSLFFFIFQ